MDAAQVVPIFAGIAVLLLAKIVAIRGVGKIVALDVILLALLVVSQDVMLTVRDAVEVARDVAVVAVVVVALIVRLTVVRNVKLVV